MTEPNARRGDRRLLAPIFTTEDARAVGLSSRQLARPPYERLFWGAYTRTDALLSFADQVEFALGVVPAAEFAAQHTAAHLLGGITPRASDLHFGSRRRHKCGRRGVRLHFYKNASDLVLHKGIWMTGPAQTYLDLAKSLEFADLLILGDSLVRRTSCTPSELRDFVAGVTCHGARHAREVAQLVRSNVDSPNESRLRLLMVSAGLPEPMANLTLVMPNTRRKRRVDLAYENLKLAIEFDGRQHLEIEQWESDILRREELEAQGWRFVVVTSTELFKNPLRVLQRIVDAIELAGGGQIEVTTGWRRHLG
ncbi:endonuclease domain-containing protein [Flexivirga meconopsidis]|uniref:endonuclease domain-containing protein n=1 Tax=Flexivirga meconopsidis TaxID=2977121 RepID=UPI00223FAEE3|nr:DUF559 domain-containing protein [Flexivirga meconopsidis]